MRLIFAAGIGFVLSLGLGSGWGSILTGETQAPLVIECGQSSTPQLRTTLYFGTARPKGTVSELEWQIFLRDVVTSRFPDGLTVWEAQGQWRTPAGSVEHERSKILLIVHADTSAARASVREVVEQYRKSFEQESVLWETARVCVAS